MTKKSSIPTVIFIALFAGLLTANAVACPARGDRMAEYLELTPSQAESIKSLKSEKRANRGEKRETQQKIRALVKAGKADEAADVAAEQARQRVIDQAAFRTDLMQILTEEQMEKWDAMPKHDQHKGRGRGKGPRTER